MICLAPLLAIQVAVQSPLAGTWDRFRPNYDAIRYDISVTLPATDSLFAATVQAEWKRVRPGPLLIDLDSVLTVRSVTLNGKPARWRRTGNRIAVTVAPGTGTFRTAVQYDGVPVDGLIIRGSGADRTIFADNWPDRGRHWLAVQDHPADKALVSWTVDAPAGFTVVANGTLEGVDSTSAERTRWRFRIAEPIPTYTMVIGAARFAVTRQGSGVSVYTYPQDSATALSGAFRRSAEILDFFSKRIVPFPYEELRHVQSSTRFGGMENSTAIFYDEKSIHAGRMSEGTVAHETAHQWFGDAVTEADWHHIWLSEGFATYGAALWAEHVDGDSGLRAAMQRTREEVIKSAATERPILDSTVTERMRLLNTNSYQKGGWVLHTLRGLIGDSAFFQGLRRYTVAYRHRNALSRDFARIMSEAAGKNLDWYFRQALTRPGYPILEARTDLEGGHLTVTITQTQKASWGVYRMPNLQVRLGTRVITVPVTGRVTTVATHWEGAAPDSVAIDPGTWWLFAPKTAP